MINRVQENMNLLDHSTSIRTSNGVWEGCNPFNPNAYHFKPLGRNPIKFDPNLYLPQGKKIFNAPPVPFWANEKSVMDVLKENAASNMYQEMQMRLQLKEEKAKAFASDSTLVGYKQKEDLFYLFNPEAMFGKALGIDPHERYCKAPLVQIKPGESLAHFGNKVERLCDNVESHKHFWKSSFEYTFPKQAPYIDINKPFKIPEETIFNPPAPPESFTEDQKTKFTQNYFMHLFQRDQSMGAIKEKFAPIFDLSKTKSTTQVPLAAPQSEFQLNFARGLADFKHFQHFTENQLLYPPESPERLSYSYLKQNIIGPDPKVGGQLAYFGGNLAGHMSNLGDDASLTVSKFKSTFPSANPHADLSAEPGRLETACKIAQLADAKGLEMSTAISKGMSESTAVEDAFRAIYGCGLSDEPHKTFYHWEQSLQGKFGFQNGGNQPTHFQHLVDYTKNLHPDSASANQYLSYLTEGSVEGWANRLLQFQKVNPEQTYAALPESKLKPGLHLDHQLLQLPLETLGDGVSKPKAAGFYQPPVVVSFGNKEMAHGTSCFMNGIANTLKDASFTASNMSGSMNGYKIDLIYNPTLGFNRDLMKQKFIKEGYMIPAAKEYKDYIINYFRANEHNDKKMHLNVHSQGGAILNSILPEIPEEYRNRMYIDTYGTAAFIKKGMAARIRNFWHPNDNVSKLADPMGLVQAKKDGTLVELPEDGLATWNAHKINKGYKDFFEQNCKAFANGEL